MERLNDIGYTQKLQLLRMMYPDLKEIHSKYQRLYVSKSNGKIKVLDINANIISEFNTEEYDIFGGYLIAESNTDKFNILNLRTNKHAYMYFDRHHNTYQETNGLLVVKSYSGCKIINNELETIWNNIGCLYIGYDREDSLGYWYNYKCYDSRNTYKKLRINKVTEKVDIYDTIELEDNYSIIGTEVRDKYAKEGNIKLDRLSYIRYKLAYGGNIISNKSYCDVLKLNDIQNSEYFYCYEFIGNNIKMGLLNGKGKELLHPEYNNIARLNNQIFVVELDNARRIIDFSNGYYSDLIDKNLLYIHNTLPIILMLENNSWVVYDAISRKYRIEDITSKLECWYCHQYPEFLRVNVNLLSEVPAYKYITRNLETVLDTRLIHMFNTLVWNRV